MTRHDLIDVLEDWRKRAGLDKLGVANLLGCSRQLVSGWLQPHHSLTPSIKQVVEFGHACGVSEWEVARVVLLIAGLDRCAIPDSAEVKRDKAA